MKQKITIEQVVTVEFDENSKEFKNLFVNYNKYFRDCDLEEFSEIIAKSLCRDGIESLEGIGLVNINGKLQVEFDHPINIIAEVGFGCINGSVTSTEEL